MRFSRSRWGFIFSPNFAKCCTKIEGICDSILGYWDPSVIRLGQCVVYLSNTVSLNTFVPGVGVPLCGQVYRGIKYIDVRGYFERWG